MNFSTGPGCAGKPDIGPELNTSLWNRVNDNRVSVCSEPVRLCLAVAGFKGTAGSTDPKADLAPATLGGFPFQASGEVSDKYPVDFRLS